MNLKTETSTSIFRSSPQPGLVQLTFDMPGKSANVLTQAMFDQLEHSLDELESEKEQIKGLILYSAKPKIFFAGADLNLISESLDWPDENIRDFCRRGQNIFSKLGNFPFPSIAAIHGICVGGGLELALACDFRICSDARNTLLGLPEVNLGLIPGWCGTARTPRLIGLAEGMDLVTSGRLVNSDEADALLLVDDIATHDQLLGSCIEFLDSCTEKQLADRRKIMNSPIIASQIKDNPIDEWESKINSSRDIHAFAPMIAAEHMIRSAAMTLNEAGESEGVAMSKVWGSDSCQALLNMFFVDEKIKKNPGSANTDVPYRDLSPHDLKWIGIVGAGQMGSQLARVFSKKFNVAIYDAKFETAEGIAKQLENKTTIVTAAKKFGGLTKCDLVIESIVENTKIKRDVLSRLEPLLRDDAVIATNTSAIPVGDLTSALENPRRLIGLHFCHPISRRKLCEVIPSNETDAQTIATAIALVRGIKKSPLLVADSPGFVVNRLLASYLDQAINLLGMGVEFEAIENAARDFGFEVGPFEFIDAIGIDTLFYTGILFAERLPHLVGRSKILPHLIKADRLGKKTSLGFYAYESGDMSQDPSLDDVLKNAMQEQRIQQQPSHHEIVMALLMPMLVEAISLLDQHLVRDANVIDFCLVHGGGFPAHRGGLLFWADQIGATSIISEIENAKSLRPSLTVPKSLEEMSNTNRKFYE